MISKILVVLTALTFVGSARKKRDIDDGEDNSDFNHDVSELD
jgi:hypothetical protein